MAKRTIKFGKVLFHCFSGIFILLFIFKQIPVSNLDEVLKHSRFNYIPFVFIFVGVSLLLNAFRWYFLLKAIHKNLSLTYILRLVFISFFFNTYLPGGVMGDLVRLWLFTSENEKNNWESISLSVVLDRLSGLLGIGFMASFGFLFSFYKLSISVRLIFAFILLFLLLAVFFVFFPGNQKIIRYLINICPFKRINGSLEHFLKAIILYQTKPLSFLFSLVFGILSNFAIIISFFIAGLAVGIQIGLVYYFLFIPLIELVSALPISIGGVGIRDSLMVYMFSFLNIAQEVSLSVSLIIWAIYLLTGVAGAFFYMIELRSIRFMKLKNY